MRDVILAGALKIRGRDRLLRPLGCRRSLLDPGGSRAVDPGVYRFGRGKRVRP
jgi:hypothetical protein